MQKLISVLLFVVITGSSSAQKDSLNLPLYKRFPTVAPFKLLKADSVSYFTKADLKKNRGVLLIIFSPDCEHCQHETEELTKRMDDFKKIQIVMATTWPLSKMKDFYAKYDLKRFSNILMGQDVTSMLPTYYHISNMPFMAFYDKKGNLIDTAEGSLPVEKVLAKFE